MSPELDAALCSDFPLLYQNREHFGFECGDGWEPLIRKLSQRIMDEISDANDDPPYTMQVKQKFGGLRYYMSHNVTPKMEAAISEAEAEADRTCEVCGKPGSRLRTGGGGWVRTLCGKCR